jgi:hypothetical protein
MLYNMKLKQTTAAPRVVDARSLPHVQATKAAKACDAADASDGFVVLQNLTDRILAIAYGVSTGSVARAKRLTPEQRQAVGRKQRPLVLPRIPVPPRSPALPVLPLAPATPAVSPVMSDAREQLRCIVNTIGIDATLNLLAATEKAAA